MNKPVSVEYMFSDDFLKFLKQEEDLAVKAVTDGMENFHEYTHNVGYIRAIRSTKERYERLLKAYFKD